MNIFQKIIIIALGILLLVVSGALGTLLVNTHNEYAAFRVHEAKLMEELVLLREAFEEQESYLDRLVSDPEFFERVVRQKLGYSSPDELIFRFQEPSPL